MAKKKLPKTEFSATPVMSAEDVNKRIKQVENLPTVYFNHARVAAGFLDVRIFLGEQSVTPTGDMTFTESLCIAMTPEFAMLLSTLLSKQLEQYPLVFGKLRSVPTNPAALQAALEEARKKLTS
jgi:hypothetical protein